MNHPYISRTVYDDQKSYTEAELLEGCSLVIVLAEPGAGKTELLNHLAEICQSDRVRASIFRSRQAQTSNTLIIDAMDEVARIDEQATSDIIVKASEQCRGTLVLASRSGEWDTAQTKFAEECRGQKARVVRLHPFSEEERRKLFGYCFPNEDFDHFAGEVSRFDLTPLLGNPQFLQLLGEGYLESGRRYSSKAQIFSDAVTRLAHDASSTRGKKNRPSNDTVVAFAGEIFAKLLLSGASGISVAERLGGSDFPFLHSLSNAESSVRSALLDSRLFKPLSDADLHEPVHRIVAEYGAARYLVSRLEDTGDLLSRARLFSLIAPNGVVRDELRGLIAWMAALGQRPIEEEIIDLDPYAVLANGDPSQLCADSKRDLVQRLRDLAREDPMFRRSDSWRRFNVGGFFEGEILEDIRTILSVESEDIELRDLLLELLCDDDRAPSLETEARALAVDSNAGDFTRTLALRLLTNINEQSAVGVLPNLLLEESFDALQLAIRLTSEIGVEKFPVDSVFEILQRYADFPNKPRENRDRKIGVRHLVKGIMADLSHERVVNLLDRFTTNLSCTCGATRDHRCSCRVGVSGVVGGLLDRYFELDEHPHDAARIWSWIKDLIFDGRYDRSEGKAVEYLKFHDALRREIQLLALEGASDREQISEAMTPLFAGQGHVGPRFHADDLIEMTERAYQARNLPLWSELWQRHDRAYSPKQPNAQRKVMRDQARNDPAFMRLWAKHQRDAQQAMFDREERGLNRSHRRYERREKRRTAQRFESLRSNRDKIERGEHWGWLKTFASYYLIEPEKLSEVSDDPETVLSALRNCFPLLAGHVPTVSDLAGRNGQVVAQVLTAACIVHFRENGNLDGIDLNILAAVRVDPDYPANEGEEAIAFEAELDRLLFNEPSDAEAFVRDLVEPQLASTEDRPTDVGMLEHKRAFQQFRETLPIEWLERFPQMPFHAEQTLFKLASKYCDMDRVLELIRLRAEIAPTISEEETDANKSALVRHRYWVLNSFFFHDEPVDGWTKLKSDPRTIFAINDRIGRYMRFDGNDSPNLSPEKIYEILDAFVEAWPKVYLPGSFGSGDPPNETAYRFLGDLVWRITDGNPQAALSVLNRLLADDRFGDFDNALLNMKATTIKKMALSEFSAPAATPVAEFLDNNAIASVEDLRAFTLEELANLQTWARGAETNPIREVFHRDGVHVDENTARNRLVERLEARMTALGMPVVIEHHMANSNRCDFTVSASSAGTQLLLTVEVKGQWHPELFYAADTQLNAQYAIHPDAAGQGIYLVLWYGPGIPVAGKQSHSYTTPSELHGKIVDEMPEELHGLIDVFVLDLSARY